MLTCSVVVSPLRGPSSPSDLVSLTTRRAASSLASLPWRREQCRRDRQSPPHCRRETVPWPQLGTIRRPSHRCDEMVWVQGHALHGIKKDSGCSTRMCCSKSKYSGTSGPPSLQYLTSRPTHPSRPQDLCAAFPAPLHRLKGDHASDHGSVVPKSPLHPQPPQRAAEQI